MQAKSILITGSSTGIGYDAAHALKARGWRVFATCRKPEDVARLRDEGMESFTLDYEDPETITAALTAILEATGGQLNALFNNGAYAIPAPLEDVPRDAMRAIFEANLIGWHDLTNQVIPVMRAQGHGRIVNCSSVLGIVGAKWRGAYVATKFALEGMTDVLRMEMRGTGIDVSLIEPGPITTAFRQNAVAEFEKWIDWESSARAEEYRATLLDLLHKGSSGPSWPPSAVTKKLIHAVESPRPRPRYFVTTPTHIASGLRRILPTSLLDRALGRA